jgi:hypothetical protein
MPKTLMPSRRQQKLKGNKNPTTKLKGNQIEHLRKGTINPMNSNLEKNLSKNK